jgi:exopolyphosphatase
MARLKEFLVEARRSLAAAEQVALVFGNESADLDSVASALAYAASSAVPSASQRQFVPVINIPRVDFSLRTDIVWLLAEMSVTEDDLFFADDTEIAAITSAAGSGSLEIVLVDHNNLGPKLSHLADSVVTIVDHHVDEGLHPDADRTISPCGSCASLVAHRFLGSGLGAEVSKLLMAAIMVDTIGLDPSKGRFKPEDAAAMAALKAENSEVDVVGLFDAISAEKKNISNLDVGQLLRRDYKQRECGPFVFGIASVSAPLAALSNKPDPAAAVEGCITSNGLDALAVMTAYTDGDGRFSRELAIFANDEALQADLASALVGTTGDVALGLAPTKVAGFEKKSGAIYRQSAITQSRKKVLPLFLAFFEARAAAAAAANAQ